MAEARVMAVQHAFELLRDQPTMVWDSDELRLEVTDAKQLLLFNVMVIGVEGPAATV